MAFLQNLNFVPTSIAGCQLWLDAADRDSLVLTGNTVSQWNDKSGNGRNTTTLYGTPILRTDGFGGRPSVYLTSSSAFTGPITNTGTTVTAFVVGRLNTSISNPYRMVSLGQAGRYDFGNTNDIVALTTGNATTELGWYRNYSSPGVGGANVATIYNAGFLYNVVVNGSTGVIWLNGGTTASGTTSGSFGYSTYGIGVGFTIGSPGVGPYITDGYIAEFIIYNAALTTVQRQQVEGYLAWKWGLQGNLPSTHPYKLIAPNSANLGYPSALTVAVPQISFAQSALPLAFFNPLSITGCVLWLDALNPSNTGTLPAAGSTVSTWTDRSGNANNATGGSATFQLNILNGFPAITFAGNTVYSLARPTILSTGQSSGSTLFLVFRVTSTSVTDAGIFGQSPANPGTCDKTGRVLYYNSGGTLFGTMYCGFASTSTSYTAGQGALVSDVYTNTGVGNYTHTSFLNGTAFGTTGATVTGANTSSYIAQIGALNVGGTNYTGNIFEILYFNNTLSTTSRQQIEGYLAWKWGLTGSLPSNHPYKNNMPTAFGSVPIGLFGIKPASFQPTSIAGCSVWLDAADAASIVTSGTSVTQWNDKSGNSRTFTSVANPNYIANVRNGQGVVRFSNSYLQSPSVALFSSASSGGSFFFVFQTSNNAAQSFLLTYQNQTSGVFCQTETEIGIDTGAGTGVGNFGLHRGCGYATIAAANTIANNTFYLMELILSTSGTTPTNVAIFQNGTSLSVSNDSLGYYSAGSYPNANNARSLVLGGRANIGASPDAFFTGDMAEVLWYSGPVSVVQRQQIEGYLAWKWGLVGNLPANHPFKKFPPPPS